MSVSVSGCGCVVCCVGVLLVKNIIRMYHPQILELKVYTVAEFIFIVTNFVFVTFLLTKSISI